MGRAGAGRRRRRVAAAAYRWDRSPRVGDVLGNSSHHRLAGNVGCALAPPCRGRQAWGDHADVAYPSPAAFQTRAWTDPGEALGWGGCGRAVVTSGSDGGAWGACSARGLGCALRVADGDRRSSGSSPS